MGGHTAMDHEAADRISDAVGRDPGSDTVQSGFDDRAQAAADRNNDTYDTYDDEIYDGDGD